MGQQVFCELRVEGAIMFEPRAFEASFIAQAETPAGVPIGKRFSALIFFGSFFVSRQERTEKLTVFILNY